MNLIILLSALAVVCAVMMSIIHLELTMQKLFKISIRYNQLPLARKLARDLRLDHFNTTYNQAAEQEQEIVWFYVSASNKKARAFLDLFNSESNEPPKLLHTVIKNMKKELYD